MACQSINRGRLRGEGSNSLVLEGKSNEENREKKHNGCSSKETSLFYDQSVFRCQNEEDLYVRGEVLSYSVFQVSPNTHSMSHPDL